MNNFNNCAAECTDVINKMCACVPDNNHEEKLNDHVSDSNVHFVEDEKQQLTNILLSASTFALLESLEDYYTSSQIDDKGFLQEVPDYYITLNELDYMILSGRIVSNALDYYTRAQIDRIFSFYYTKEQIEQREAFINSSLGNYYNKPQIDELLQNAPAHVSYEPLISGSDNNAYEIGTLLVDDSRYTIYALKSISGGSADGPAQDDDWNVNTGYYVSIYTKSVNLPATPSNSDGSYNFKTNEFFAPEGWQTSVPAYGDGVIWQSSNRFWPNGTNDGWTTPVLLFTPESLLESLKKTETCQITIYAQYNGTAKLNRPEGGALDVSSRTLNTEYGMPVSKTSSDETVNWYESPIDMDGKIYVSFATWVLIDDVVVSKSRWSDPALYRDLGKELANASAIAESFYNNQLSSAESALNEALTNAKNLSDVAQAAYDAAISLQHRVESGEIDAVGLLSQIDTIKGQISNYGWSVDYMINYHDFTNYYGDIPYYAVADIIGTSGALNDVHHFEDRYGVHYFKINVVDGRGATLTVPDESSRYMFIECSANGVIGDRVLAFDNATNLVFFEADGPEIIYCKGSATPFSKYVSSLFDAVAGKYNLTIGQSNPDSQKYLQALIDATMSQIVTKLSSADGSAIKSAVMSVTEDSISTVITKVDGLNGELEDVKQSINNQTADQTTIGVISGKITEGDAFDAILSALIDIIKDLITLSITGDDGKSVSIGLDGESLTVVIDAPQTTITGELIAEAIETDGLEIRPNVINVGGQLYYNDGAYSFDENGNVVDEDGNIVNVSLLTKVPNSVDPSVPAIKLQSDGTAIFGANGDSATTINPDGTGEIAGGLIKWDRTEDIINSPFLLTILGIIDAQAGKIGGWTVANNAMVAFSPDEENPSTGVQLAPSALVGGAASKTDKGGAITKPGWCLNADGSGYLASGLIRWDEKGNLPIILAKILTTITADNYRNYLLKLDKDWIYSVDDTNVRTEKEYQKMAVRLSNLNGVNRNDTNAVKNRSLNGYEAFYILDLSACGQKITITSEALEYIEKDAGGSVLIFLPSFYRISSADEKYDLGNSTGYQWVAPYTTNGKCLSYTEFIALQNSYMIEYDNSDKDYNSPYNSKIGFLGDTKKFTRAYAEYFDESNAIYLHIWWLYNGQLFHYYERDGKTYVHSIGEEVNDGGIATPSDIYDRILNSNSYIQIDTGSNYSDTRIKSLSDVFELKEKEVLMYDYENDKFYTELYPLWTNRYSVTGYIFEGFSLINTSL